MSAASGAAKVVGDLQLAKAGIGRAVDKATEAIAGAGRAGGEFAQLGYARVHAEMEGIRRRVEQLLLMLAEASKTLDQGAEYAGGVTDELSAQDADKLWHATIGQVDQATGHLQRAHQHARNVEADIAIVMRGARPEYLLSLLAGVKDGVRQAGETAVRAKETVRAAGVRGTDVSGN